MQRSMDQRPNLSSVVQSAELKVPLRLSFLGKNVRSKLHLTCRPIRHRSGLRLCTTGSQAGVRDADCACTACTAPSRAVSSCGLSAARRRLQVVSATAPSSSEATSELADVPSTADQDSVRRLQPDSNGAVSTASSSGNGSGVHDHGVNGSQAFTQLVRAPEDLMMEPGVLSSLDRGGSCHQADVFRCTGCSEPACQVGALLPAMSPESDWTSQHQETYSLTKFSLAHMHAARELSNKSVKHV